MSFQPSFIPSASGLERGYDERPARARQTDPATSHAAAASVVELTRKQAAVLRAMGTVVPGALTDQGISRVYARCRQADPDLYPAQSESGLRTRRKELADQGLVRDTGMRVTLDSGRKAIVWKACANQAGIFATRAAA